MARAVANVLGFLLSWQSFAFTHANQYSLAGNKTDACFQPSQKATAECLQELIESYYGKYFTNYCLEFPQLLAELRCTGCPWDRLDPKKINPDIAMKYRAFSNETELFHEPSANCNISKYVKGLGTFHGIANYVIRWAFVGSIPIFFSTGSIIQYTSGQARLTRPSMLGWKVHEWMFMGAVWVSYKIGIIMLSISEEYYRYCDTAASNLGLVITRDLSYFALIYYSFSRCRQLRFPQTENNGVPQLEEYKTSRRRSHSMDACKKAEPEIDSIRSWYTFVIDREGMSWREYIRSKKLIVLCVVYGFPAAALFICIVDSFCMSLIKYYKEEGYICSISSVEMSARAIAVVKLTLEPLVHIVYSFGASTRNKAAYCIRYVVLAITASICLTVLVLMSSKSLHRPNGLEYLFWRVPLRSAVSEITEMSHVLAVSIFGLLEPLRYGSIYPRHEKVSDTP